MFFSEGGSFTHKFPIYKETWRIVCSGCLRKLNSHLSGHLIQYSLNVILPTGVYEGTQGGL